MGVAELPIYYFFVATSGELDPRKIRDNDPRLKPIGVDPTQPLRYAIPTLTQEFIQFMDFESPYICRLYAPKGNVLERSWLSLRLSMEAQQVTEYDYVVVYPLKLQLKTRLRSWQGEMKGWLIKRSIKGTRKTGYKKRWCILSHNFLLYFEKNDPSSFPLGMFAVDFYKVEKLEETKKKGFKQMTTTLIRFTPLFAFGKSDPVVYELSHEDPSQVGQWYALLYAKMANWDEN